MSTTETLDVAVLRALVGEARVSLDSARLLLDEARASASDLEDDALRGLWAVIEARIRSRTELDTASLMAGAQGGPQRALMASILASPPLGVLTERLALLRERAVRARALEALRRAAMALQAGRPVAEVAALAREVPGILDGVKGRVRETRGDTMAILDAAASAWTDGRRQSLPTGWHVLDADWRLVPSLHVVGAHPGVGKSAFVAGLVRQWTRAHVKVGVLAYEDDAVDLQRRILACDACLSLAQLQGDAPVDGREMATVEDATRARIELEQYLLADDAYGGTISDAIASAREMHARGARVIVLDNMSCVRLDGSDDRHLELEQALLQLRSVATQLKVPIIVVGHLKRGMSDGDELTKRPKLTDFAGAAAWERTCRSALGMWWENNEVCMRVLKQTNGVSGGEFTLEVRQTAATVVGVERREVEVRNVKANGRYSRE
jgi:hypothetical protein